MMSAQRLGAAVRGDPWGLILSGVSGLAVGFILWYLRTPDRTFHSYLFFNNLSSSDRIALMAISLSGAILLVLFWVVTSIARSGRAEPLLRRIRAWLPGGVLFLFVPPLAVQAIETYRVFHTFALVAALATTAMLITYRAMVAGGAGYRRAGRLAPSRRTDHVCMTLLIGITVAYAAYFVVFTLGRHRSFHSHAFDLGWQQQAFYTLLRTGNPRVTLWATLNHFGNHFQPVYFLLAPLYAIHPDASTLVVLQSVLLSTASIPIYLFARERLGDSRIALAVAFCYLLYPPLHGVNNYDFHGLSLLVPISAFMLYAMDTRRNWLFWIMFALGLMTREDAPISLAGVGLYLLLQPGRRRTGALVTVICVAYFLGVGLVMKALDGYPDLGNYWALTLPQDRSFTGVVGTLLSNPHYVLTHVFGNPEKIRYLIHLLLPLAFLPLAAARAVVLVVPGISIMLLSNTFFNYSIATPYSSHVIAPLFYLTVLGIEGVRRWTHRGSAIPQSAVVAMLLAAAVTMNLEFGLVVSKRFPGFLRPSERLQTAYSLFQLIPDEASVATDTRFVPHLAGRTEIRLSHAPNSDYDYVLIDVDAREPAIDTHEAWYRGTQYPGVSEARRSAVRRLESGEYGVVSFRDGLILLGRDFDTAGNPAAVERIRNSPIDEAPELIPYYTNPVENVNAPVRTESDRFEQMLKSSRRGTVVLAFSGGATGELSYLCLKYMMLKGSNVHTLRPGGSYLAVVRNDEFVLELINNDGPATVDARTSDQLRALFPQEDLRLASSGDADDGYASIQFAGAEYASDGPGMKAVILDGRGRIEEGLSYDTGR